MRDGSDDVWNGIMKRSGIIGLTVLLILALYAGLASARSLRVGVDVNYPPFSTLEADGRLHGFNVDLAELICRDLQQPCQFVGLPLEELISALEKGELDMVVASLAKTPQRDKRVDFTDCYYKARTVFIGPSSMTSLGEVSPEKIAAKRLAAVKGSIQYDYLQKHFGRACLISAADNIDDLLSMLENGETDIVLMESLVASPFLQSEKGRPFDFIGEALDADDPSSTAYIALTKGRDQLREKVNQAIARIKLKPVYDNLFREYFGYSI